MERTDRHGIITKGQRPPKAGHDDDDQQTSSITKDHVKDSITETM
jgi:hypothetical protein